MPGQPGFRSRQELEGRGFRGRRRAPSSLTGKNLFLTGLVVLLLMFAGMLALRSLAVSIQNGGDDEVTQKKSVPSTVKPTQSKDPFADTLAAEYPEGAEGIVMPAAKQVGQWTPAQVQDVLNRTKQTLVAARLDRQMLEQGDPAGYLGTISASARGPVTKSIEAGEGLVYVSRLGSEYKLTGEPRVKGTMAVSLGPKKELVIAADYVWIYPLDGPVYPDAAKGPGSKLVVVHTEETYQWFETKKVAPKDTGLRPGAGKLYSVNMDCDLAKTGKLGLPRAAPVNPGDVPDAAAYDPATKPDELPETC